MMGNGLILMLNTRVIESDPEHLLPLIIMVQFKQETYESGSEDDDIHDDQDSAKKWVESSQCM